MSNVKLNIDNNSINKIISTLQLFVGDSVKTALEVSTPDIERLLDRHTPKKTGELRRSKNVIIQNGQNNSYRLGIRYDAPYAKYQYDNKGGRFKKYTTPGTGDHWLTPVEDEIKSVIHKNITNQLTLIGRK